MRSEDRHPLRVLAWGHPRCWRPLAAAGVTYSADFDVEIEVSVRSLADFGDAVPCSRDIDIVLIDHPHLGKAAADGQIVALDGLLDATTIAERVAAAIGPSGVCYEHAGQTWAIPVDAACHALACAHSIDPPLSIDAVLALSSAQPGQVALPLQPAHALSAFISIVAALGARDAVAGFIEPSLAADALEVMALLVGNGPAAAHRWDPPEALTALEAQEIECVPYTYGYVGYDVQWSDAPARSTGETPGSVLGGVGMAVMAGSRDPVAAAQFAGWFGGRDVQRTIVTPTGGQPAEAGAWAASTDPMCAATQRSMNCAVVRPRDAWWPAFQRAAGEILHANLIAGTPAGKTARTLAQRYDRRQESVYQ